MTGPPTFNLWHDAWITVEQLDGSTADVGIVQTLREAHMFRALDEQSPLVVAGIHRLLTAIAQAIIRPHTSADLLALWRAKRLPADAIDAFGAQYAHRFDLFSQDAPFMQSADIPRDPEKRGKGKSVGYLLQEEPAGSGVAHYRHVYEAEQVLCAVCAARGLVTIPAFASSGGAGIKPSINGVPPIYVLPGGDVFFESLAASIVLPRFQPTARDDEHDTPWWEHHPVVGKKTELLRVGYLHSLTFPARRIRLHPEPLARPCTRCGRQTTWGVAEMVYEQGESRPKEAAWWQDPFAAYRLQKEKEPLPVRPVEGRSLWREYGALLLPTEPVDNQRGATIPAFIDQLQQVVMGNGLYPHEAAIPLTLIGLRTDMKMKLFEWQRDGLKLPPALLDDYERRATVREALNFAGQYANAMRNMFRQHFGGDGKTKRHENLNTRMQQHYWRQLAPHFRQWVLAVGHPAAKRAALTQLDADWHAVCFDEAMAAFNQFAGYIGDDAATLRMRVEADNHLRAVLYTIRDKAIPETGEEDE